MDVHRPDAALVPLPPHALEQLLARVRATRMGRHERQEAELLRPEVDGQRIAPELVSDQVQLEAVCDRQRGAGHGDVPRPCLEPVEARGQLPGRGRRRQRVVEAPGQGGDAVGDGARGREVEGAEPGSAASFGRHEIQVLVTSGWLADDHDPRSFREQDVPEASGVGGDTDRPVLAASGRSAAVPPRRPARARPLAPRRPGGQAGRALRSGLERRHGDHGGASARPVNASLGVG